MGAAKGTQALGLAAVLLALGAVAAAGGQEQAAAARDRGVSLYLLKDPKLTVRRVVTMPLEALPLRDEPWIASANIERYDASAGLLYLKRPVAKPWERMSLGGTAFVVTADGERCYLGGLWATDSSYAPPGGLPTISDWVWHQGTTDVIPLQGMAKVLNDERVLRVLKRDGQFSAGIEVTLDNVVVLPDGKGAVVRYTYTVTNRDRDALYLLDTDRMDYDYFRRMQNGIACFTDPDGDAHVPRPDPPEGMKALALPIRQADPKWFVRVASGESMTRTATEPHFRRVPTGRYSCVFHYGFRGDPHGFGGPRGKRERERKDGRVWFGHQSASRKVEVEGPVEF